MQEAGPARRICGAHGGYETAEVCDVRIIGGGRGLCGGPGKRVDGVFPGRPQSFRHQRTLPSGRLQPRTRGNGTERRNKGRNSIYFMAKWIPAEKIRAGLRHAVVCPNVTGRTKKRIAQSKRAHTGSLTLVN